LDKSVSLIVRGILAVFMTVDYQLERSDFRAFEEERRRFMPDSLRRIYYFAILPALGVGLAVATESFVPAMIFTVLFVGSGWAMQERIQRAYRRNAYSDDNLSFSLQRWSATLAGDGLRVSSEAAEVLYRWPFIRQVFRGSCYVHFELTPLQRVHIPLRAFRDEEHIQKFVSTAQSFLKRPVG